MSEKLSLKYILVCSSFAILFLLSIMVIESGFGLLQNKSNSTTSNSTNLTTTNNTISKMVKINSSDSKALTDGKSIGIGLQIKPFPITNDVNSEFKITFLQPNLQVVQPHVEYDFVISKMNNEVFRASSVSGDRLLHTAEGTVTIPYKFNEGGQYSLLVTVSGINLEEIKPEKVLFGLNVS